MLKSLDTRPASFDTSRMPPAGYYKTNMRVLRFRECVRMWGFRRALTNYFKTRLMHPTPGGWMPGLWSESERKKEDFSEEFWLATKPHRKDFEDLGFTQCRLAKSKNLNLRIRDSGLIGYLDSTRSYFGQVHYIKVRRATNRDTNEIHITVTAMFENGSLSCTNNRISFDSFDESDITYLNSFDVKVIYQKFLERVQRRKGTPRQFPDIESLRQWFDARQWRLFEERVRRRLYLPMTEAEAANAQAIKQSGAPPLPVSVRSSRGIGKVRWFLWILILGCLLALRFIHPAWHGASRSSDTIEYRGQHFKMSKAYPSYEDYKDDPNNLNTNELDRIEQAMTNAPVPATFKDSDAFLRFMLDLEFPGYGLGGLGVSPQIDDGSTLLIESVEIPQRGKERVIAVRQARGQLKTINDFVYKPEETRISAIKLEKQTLRFYDPQNRLLREKHL